MGGSLTFDEIQDMIQNRQVYKDLKHFVETGTYRGTTSCMAAKHYEHVYTTEIVEALHNYSKHRAHCEGLDNISFYLGDSVELLKDIAPKVLDGAVFFIDAHQSGPDSSNNGKNVPLFEELEVILSSGELSPSLFIFDDTRFWQNHSQQAWDWEHVSTNGIVEMFKKYNVRLLTFLEHNDRFWVFTK